MNLVRTGILMAGMTALFMAVGYIVGGQGGMIIAFVIAAGTNIFNYWNSDKMVLRMHNAVQVDDRTAPELYEIVRRLAEAADLPMPAVYVIDSDQPNAFATGRNPENSAVAASTGLLNTLSMEEVAGVMAHELAHIQNRDTLIMTITATFAGAISMLANFAMFFGSRERGGFLSSLVVMIGAPFAASIVQMAISRTREYAADRRGAEICGNPIWLASALEKISKGAAQVPNHIAEQNPSTAHMFIINPLGLFGRDRMFSTHPDTQNRIDALVALEQEWAGGYLDDDHRELDTTSHFDESIESEHMDAGPWGNSSQKTNVEINKKEPPQPWGRPKK